MPLNRNLVPGSINRSVRSKLWGRGRDMTALCCLVKAGRMYPALQPAFQKPRMGKELGNHDLGDK